MRRLGETSADFWAGARLHGEDWAAGATVGAYFALWCEEHLLSEVLVGEVRRALARRGLTLESDDRGLRVDQLGGVR